MAGPPATTAPREEPETDPVAPMFEKIGTDGVELHQETSPPEAVPATGEDAVDANDRVAASDPLEPESVPAAPVAAVRSTAARALPLLAHTCSALLCLEEGHPASASACTVCSPPR